MWTLFFLLETYRTRIPHPQREGHETSSEIDFVVGDALNLPCREGLFDAVLAMDFLEDVSDPNRAMSQLKDVLKSRGIITAFVPCEGNRLSFYYLFFRLFGFNVKGPAGGHVQALSKPVTGL